MFFKIHRSNRMNLIFIVIFLLSFAFTWSFKNPIVIIPGIGGSHIDVKMNKNAKINPKCRTGSDNYFTLWVNTAYAITHSPTCIFEAMKLIYNNATGKTNNAPGIHTRIPGFGQTNTVEYLDSSEIIAPYFSAFVKRMMKEGYSPGFSIRAAPYDFRKAPNELGEYFKNLKMLIEETYNTNDNKKIILVVHSLGGPVSLAFLQHRSQEWKDKYIQYQISLSGVWAGTIKAIESFIKGLTLRGTEFTPKLIDPNTPQELSVPHIVLPFITLIPKETLRSLPAIIWLFPSLNGWTKTDMLVRTEEKNYTLGNIEEFFSDMNYLTGLKMYKNINIHVRNLMEPGVELHCLYGTGIRTISSVDSSRSFLDILRYEINGDGDGLVNLQSLEVCKKWIGGKKKIMTKSFWGLNHVTIVSDSAVLDYIVNLTLNN